MARNLYDLDDRETRSAPDGSVGPQEKPGRILPLGTLLVALAFGAGALLLLKDLLPVSATKTVPPISPTIITATFTLCDQDRSGACVLSANGYILEGQLFRVADIQVPSPTGARCPQEQTMARKGRHALLGLLNGGAFEARPVPSSADPQARLLIRDTVSLGSLMVMKGFARIPSRTPVDWCDPGLT